jgi:hypothetical protein
MALAEPGGEEIMLKAITKLALAVLTVAVTSLSTIDAKAEYRNDYQYNSAGKQTFGQHYR